MENEAADPQIDLFPDSLEIDEAELQDAAEERGTAADLTPELRLLARQNRLSLLKIAAGREQTAGGGWRADTLLRFASLADPACRFVRVALTIELLGGPGTSIHSIDPRSGGTQIVKYRRKIAPSLESGIAGMKFKAVLAAETETEYTSEYPLLVGDNGETWAGWTFSAPVEENELKLDHLLRISADVPSGTPPGLHASIEITARVAFRDWKSVVPLIGRREVSRSDIIYLDR